MGIPVGDEFGACSVPVGVREYTHGRVKNWWVQRRAAGGGGEREEEEERRKKEEEKEEEEEGGRRKKKEEEEEAPRPPLPRPRRFPNRRLVHRRPGPFTTAALRRPLEKSQSERRRSTSATPIAFLAAAGLPALRRLATAPTRHGPASLTPPPP
ncbi:uncharacterized protein LOC133892263 [Phragmites australis]|uniref:uncharacterized protein LOC133892263 n=1 Tax=Phragmites australis TaxID=29695 RepID=UPI002D77D7F7|nr:uncharacterized protein LOC133892263 [Phragmites australis]